MSMHETKDANEGSEAWLGSNSRDFSLLDRLPGPAAPSNVRSLVAKQLKAA